VGHHCARGERPAPDWDFAGNTEGAPGSVAGLATLRQTLQALGWSEGRDVQIDVRWGQADLDHIGFVARGLVELWPDVICATSTPGVAALKRETQTIPIVFVSVSDPVGSGFVESLARPGGNITGFIDVGGSLGSKWIEILRDIAPNIKHAAILFNPKTAPFFIYFREKARSMPIAPHFKDPEHWHQRAEEAPAYWPSRCATKPPRS
jgi:putative ABC transport system substrate-binding protein